MPSWSTTAKQTSDKQTTARETPHSTAAKTKKNKERAAICTELERRTHKLADGAVLAHVYVVPVPNVHAHLSPFSLPDESNHALRSGSLTVSAISCAATDDMLSPAKSPLGVICWQPNNGAPSSPAKDQPHSVRYSVHTPHGYR